MSDKGENNGRECMMRCKEDHNSYEKDAFVEYRHIQCIAIVSYPHSILAEIDVE